MIEKAVVKIISKSGEQIYKDLAQPVVTGIGKTLGLIPAAINAALTPLQIWIEQKSFNIEETKRRLAEKLNHVNPEDIVSPDGYVAIPAMQAIAYCVDSNDLRNMYANLLASSMLKEVKSGVHPSFVEIIKQLSPDEARLLKFIANDVWNGDYPIVDLKKVKISNRSYDTVISNFTNIGEKICDSPYQGVQRYIINLKRLGIIDIPFRVTLKDESRYIPLEKHQRILGITEAVKLPEGWGWEIERKKFGLTDYGRQFIDICVKDL